jgi:hypothetical protein
MNFSGSGLISGQATIANISYLSTPYSIEFIIYDSNVPATQTGDAPSSFTKFAGETFIIPTQGNIVRTEQSYSFPPGGGDVVVTDVNIPLHAWSDGNGLYFPGDTYTMTDSDITLSAIWETISAPTVSSVSPSSASIGATVNIYGSRLGTANTINFWRNKPATFTVLSDSHIQAVVPTASTDGRINVFTIGGLGTYLGFDVV